MLSLLFEVIVNVLSGIYFICMSKFPGSKQISLYPDWKHYLFPYLLAILAVPLFGIGLLILYFVYRKHTATRYKVTDTQITSIDSKYHRNIDLADIENISLEQSWLDRKMNIGTLILHTSASEMKMVGLENPQRLKTIMEKAVRSEQKRIKKSEVTTSDQPERDPGTMERMNYLTGLWQQGLISEKEFRKER